MTAAEGWVAGEGHFTVAREDANAIVGNGQFWFYEKGGFTEDHPVCKGEHLLVA